MTNTEENKPKEEVTPEITPIEEIKLEDTQEFKDLLEQNTEGELRDMLKDEQLVGLEFITGKKALVSIILSIKKRNAERGVATTTPKENPTLAAVTQQAGSNWQKKMNIMKELCAKAPKVKIMIPFEIGERVGSVAELQINGYKLSVMKGVYVDIPEPFAEMVQESWQQTTQAGQEKLLDRIDPETGKPFGESKALS